MEKLSRKVKVVMVDEVAGLIKKNPYLFFVNFEKVKASKTEKLRKSLKKSSSELKVVKRSILKLALKKQKLEPLCDIAETSSAVTFSKDDPTKASKILYDFAKADQNMVIRGGYMDGQVLSTENVNELAMLPPRDVMLAIVMGGMKAPIQGLANVLRGNLQKLVMVLNEVSKKKESK
ncbi:MAG: 50S ribosomal protein L10 [Omnitrophica WOR_2 bacterium RIFCSPLOWO2_12_FULL_51_24]|nr:MAG: 50S ribosomal protein L10 [Omnitrophica WOR_2 bacterium RIFCSPHIGHO2_01_FULL_49_10]OGX34371.1 MAG: 50S ribosomal protein L10 [Omnitrophica WOR_2 bacterium RIFCSPLOWO2_02_FULL_50_19]OGX42911.1 MAG: 50S ribosomal protein L10 [Omnitrophica WOR_2 bacterium RIFCSPLOWO2_12_FULL_51_24]